MHETTSATINSLPFNRTSMESKQRHANRCGIVVRAFNRTSMESKLPNIFRIDRCLRLLIEPVWNRNQQ